MAGNHTITLKGPFSVEDMRQIVDVVQMIEATRRGEQFHVFIDAPDLEGETEKLIQQINPLRPGYARTLTIHDCG